MDNILASESGTLLIPTRGQSIKTRKVKVIMVLPETMNSSSKACMKLEIYYRESDQSLAKKSNFFQQNGVELNFGMTQLKKDEGKIWLQFPFDFKSSQRVSSAEISWKIAPMASSELGRTTSDIEVQLSMRSIADSTERIEKKYSVDKVHVDTLKFQSEIMTSKLDIMFLMDNLNRINRNGVAYYRILIQKAGLDIFLTRFLF